MNGCHASAHVAQQAPLCGCFYTKMSLRIYSCDISSESPRFILSAEHVEFERVQSENTAKNNGYPDDLCF